MLSVLLAEDDSCLNALIAKNLQLRGFVVYTAKNGAEAVEKLQTCDVNTVTNSDTTLKGKEQLAFESFFTINAEGKESGTGLGLPIVSKVVKLLQGTITLEVTADTTMKVVLPVSFINKAENASNQ